MTDWLETFYRRTMNRCTHKPFGKTKHKCIRCRECDYGQYAFCERMKHDEC